MKTDLLTSSIVAVVGALIAFFVCRAIFSEIGDISFKVVEGTVSSSVADPNPEVFNYKALNPTVEVYVGDCTQYSDSGECLDNNSGIINIEQSPNTTDTVQENN